MHWKARKYRCGTTCYDNIKDNGLIIVDVDTSIDSHLPQYNANQANQLMKSSTLPFYSLKGTTNIAPTNPN
jgi:hypothetical protein